MRFRMTILIRLPIIEDLIPNRTLQLNSKFGNTGFLGIPVSIEQLSNHALTNSIGFDPGTT